MVRQTNATRHYELRVLLNKIAMFESGRIKRKLWGADVADQQVEETDSSSQCCLLF